MTISAKGRVAPRRWPWGLRNFQGEHGSARRYGHIMLRGDARVSRATSQVAAAHSRLWTAELYSNPDDSNDNVHALGLAAIVLEAPEPIVLLVPECLCGRVHAAAAYVGLSVRGCGVGAGGDVWLVGLGLAAAL